MTKKPKENVRRKILDTAEILFAQQGFDATGIDLIAKTAGITKSLIYYYFKSKEEILSELFQAFFSQSIDVKARITRILVTDSQNYDIEKILAEHTIPFLMEHKDIIKIAVAESLKEVAVTPHVNIFKYFDQNFQAAADLVNQYGIQYNRDISDLSGFFLFWAPLFSFVIFCDEWCEYYHCDLDNITILFVATYAQMYRNMVNLKFEKPTMLNPPNQSDKTE